MLSAIRSNTTEYMAKEIMVTAMDGMNETSVFPRNSSLSDIGVARRASIVFLSFSPAKLSAAITLDAMRGIMRKNGAKK